MITDKDTNTNTDTQRHPITTIATAASHATTIAIANDNNNDNTENSNRGANREESEPTYTFYIVFEYIDNDLSAVIRSRRGEFNEGVIKSLTRQLLEGLKYCHGCGVIHRDLKTSNLLLTRDGTLKIADFGLAREYKASQAMSVGVVTVWYRAPEILLGDVRYSFPIDIWSAGCVLGELFCGAPIFRGNDESQLDVIVSKCGMLDEAVWPGVSALPGYSAFRKRFEAFSPLSPNVLAEKYASRLKGAFGLFCSLLALDPQKRPTAAEALEDPWFAADPKPQRLCSKEAPQITVTTATPSGGTATTTTATTTTTTTIATKQSDGYETLGKKRQNSYDRNIDPKRPHTSSYGKSELPPLPQQQQQQRSSSSSSSSSSSLLPMPPGVTINTDSGGETRRSKTVGNGSGSTLKSVRCYNSSSISSSSKDGYSRRSHGSSSSSSYHSHYRK